MQIYYYRNIPIEMIESMSWNEKKQHSKLRETIKMNNQNILETVKTGKLKIN